MDEIEKTARYKKSPRLYVPQADFADGGDAPLAEGQAHYLRNVMRQDTGAPLRLFNGRDGEWLGTLVLSGRKASARLERQVKAQDAGPAVTALISPVKKEAFEFMIEKGTELGVARFQPVFCDHTVVRRFNPERAAMIAAEAAEQCERLDVPEILPPVALGDALAAWDATLPLFACLERRAAEPLAPVPGPCAVLVGPEGGFSEREAEMLKSCAFVRPVSLGPWILRCETALCAVLARL